MIDSRAVIHSSARLADDVEVGPYTVIGADVEIGAGSVIGPHAVINGPTVMGRNTRIFQFASIGEDPQDKKYAGEKTYLKIGDDNTFRENCTVHRGTVQDQNTTLIGHRNLFMAGSHVAHDCIVEDDVIMANAASMAGHVHIESSAILGGFTIVHQFTSIGAHAFCQMGSMITKDVLPYVIVGGHPANPRGINTEGLKRSGFSDDTLTRLRRAYKALFKSEQRLEVAREQLHSDMIDCQAVREMDAFISRTRRAILR